MQDPFSTTAALSQKGLGAFGEALTKTAETYAERKKQEREYRLKQQYPDPMTALFMASRPDLFGKPGQPQTGQSTAQDFSNLSLENLNITEDDLANLDNEDDLYDLLEERTAVLDSPAQQMLSTAGMTKQPTPKYGFTGIVGGKAKMGILPESQAELRVWENWQKQVGKNKQTLSETYNTMIPIFQQLVSTWKAASQEKEEKNIPKGLMSKVASGTADLAELQGFPMSKAYLGQRIETALVLNKLLTGQNRVIRDVIKQILVTLPTDTGIEEDMKTKIAQSIRNSFARAIGRELSPDEFSVVDKTVNRILETPAMAIPGVGKQEVVDENLVSKYMKKYPNKSKEEIMRALRKRGQ